MYNGVQTSLVIGPFYETQYQDAYLYLVYPWFMLLLFAVAGMSSRFYLEKHTDKEFIKARTVKLLVPSTIGLFVFQWIQGYYSMVINNAFESIPAGVPGVILYFIMALSGQGVLWFAQLLWFFSLLLVLIKKVEKDRFYQLCGKTNMPVLLLLTLAVYGSSMILNVPLIAVFRIGIYFLGYLTGYFVLSHEEVMNRLSKWWIPLMIGAVLLAAAFVWVYFGQDYTTHAVLDSLLCNAFAWITILAVFAFMYRYGSFENAFSKWMNRKAWGLYVFHYLVISAAAYYLKRYCEGLPSVMFYLLTAIVAFAGAFILYEIISRIPLIRWCVLGIRKQRTSKQGSKEQ
jgi:hypothetical protein